MSKKSKGEIKKEKLLRQSFKRRGKAFSRTRLAVRHHFVPVWYQKRFIPDGCEKYFYLRRSRTKVLGPDGKPLISEKVLFQRPQECFVENKLYTVRLFGVREDAIEKELFGRIDNYGSKSIDIVIEEQGWCRENGTDLWRSFMDYMGAQKLRTPKGLDWIRKILRLPTPAGLVFTPDKMVVLTTMQQILQMHGTIWTESVWEIVDAGNADVKFIVSDHPVTMYNHSCPHDSPYCRYPLDPLISLIGTKTLFPLDKNHCLILTNRQYALAPDKVDPLAERINARCFDKSIFCFLDVIRKRSLNDEQVATINLVIKWRARECVAAGKREWLYPEQMLSDFCWEDADDLLQPPRDKVIDTKSIFFGHLNGSFEGYDPYGREITEPSELKSFKKSSLVVKKIMRKKNFSEEVVDILNKEDNPSIQQQNEILIDAGKEIFGLSKGKTLEDLRHGISDEEVATFYRLIEEIWPAGLDTIEKLPKTDDTFSILYSGELDPFSVSLYMLSFGLYADRILIANPFPNPCCWKKEKSPTLDPSPYKATTYRLLYLLFEVLESWIRAGIVQIIPNPWNVDFEFRKIAMEHAEKRGDKYVIDNKDVGLLEKQLAREMFWRVPKENILKIIKEKCPNISEEETTKMLEYVDKVKKNDPTEYLPSLKETGPQMCIQHFGLNLEVLLYVSHITGAVPYTYLNVRKWELERIGKGEEPQKSWSCVSSTIASARLQLLAFPDGDFTSKIRSAGLLAGTRAYLAELKQRCCESRAESQEDLIRDFESVKAKGEQEWSMIEKILEEMLGTNMYRKGIGASFEAIVKPYFDEYHAEYLTNYLKSKLGKDRTISPVCMALFVELPHMDSASSAE